MESKMKVKVKYLGAFTEAAVSKEETFELEGASLGSLVDLMLERNGEKFRELMIDPSTENLRGGVTLLVNAHRRDMEYGLSDGDEVALLTPVAGG